MLHNIPPYNPRIPHVDVTFGNANNPNISEGNISDTISESSDNATLLSLSREDLAALGAGPIREDVRVNRKKLEGLILREKDNARENPAHKHYMEILMERTNTYIQWPSRMKIGAKTKKDLYIRIYGHCEDEVNEAKNQILNDLGPPRDLRITLKMEISYTDHSHLIGCRGQTIRKVMDDTGCHIHFPDSNRMSKEHKSNQVTIAGSSVLAVEQARSRVRELSPLVFQFSLPNMHSAYEMQINPDQHHVYIDKIQATYGVQVTVHPPNKLQQTSVSVKGCEVDSASVREAVVQIISYFIGHKSMCGIQVETTMEISPIQHPFVRSINDSNVHAIMMNTGAKIIFPDLSDGNIQHIKRSRVHISGELNCVYHARQQLLGCLPLRMIFDISDEVPFDLDAARKFAGDINVNVKMINRNRLAMERGSLASLPPPVPGRSRTIQLNAHERNTSNMFEVRRQILGATEQPYQANIPPTYMLRPTFFGPMERKGPYQHNRFGMGQMMSALPQLVLPTSPRSYQQGGHRLGPLPPLMLPTSPSLLSPMLQTPPGLLSPVLSPSFWPPTPFQSPFGWPGIASYNHDGSPSDALHSPHSSHHNSNHNLFTTYVMNQGEPSPNPDMCPTVPSPSFSHLFNVDFMNSMDTPTTEFAPTPSSPTAAAAFGHMEDYMTADAYETTEDTAEIETAENESNNVPLLENTEIQQVVNPTLDKKYKAVKAMYMTKIGPDAGPRIPTSEWSGCGFSRTYTNLLPPGGLQGLSSSDSSKKGLGTSRRQSEKDDTSDNGNGSAEGGWTLNAKIQTMKAQLLRQSQNQTNKDQHHTRTHFGLGHQQSNLLDFTMTRSNIDQPKDLPSLFIQHGLQDYIDHFIKEEIDLEIFSALTEDDLRHLDVKSYSARKKMLVLITQQACQLNKGDWTGKDKDQKK